MPSSYQEQDFFNRSNAERVIVNQAKKERSIIYGARSIQKHIGVFSRGTRDYDILSDKPKQSAKRTERNLDRIYRGNMFYTKPAMHKGTWKVMAVGKDNKPKTKDDEGIVDYTEMPRPRPPFKVYNGVRYRTLAEEKKAKLKSLREKEMAFRHAKDREDYNRIKLATRLKI